MAVLLIVPLSSSRAPAPALREGRPFPPHSFSAAAAAAAPPPAPPLGAPFASLGHCASSLSTDAAIFAAASVLVSAIPSLRDRTIAFPAARSALRLRTSSRRFSGSMPLFLRAISSRSVNWGASPSSGAVSFDAANLPVFSSATVWSDR